MFYLKKLFELTLNLLHVTMCNQWFTGSIIKPSLYTGSLQAKYSKHPSKAAAFML